MNSPVEALILLVAALAIAGILAVVTSFLWGWYVASRTLRRVPMWKIYFAVLVPPASLALSLRPDVTLAPYAYHAFVGLGAAAISGAVVYRWSRRLVLNHSF